MSLSRDSFDEVLYYVIFSFEGWLIRVWIRVQLCLNLLGNGLASKNGKLRQEFFGGGGADDESPAQNWASKRERWGLATSWGRRAPSMALCELRVLLEV